MAETDRTADDKAAARLSRRIDKLDRRLRGARRDAAKRARQVEKTEARIRSIAAELLATAEGAPDAIAKRVRKQVERASAEVRSEGAGVLSRAADAAAGAAGLAAGAAGRAAGVAGKAVGVVADVTTTLTRREEANGASPAASATPRKPRARRTPPEKS